jgi:ABC-type branched-subunit amino acid transport system ATPase component
MNEQNLAIQAHHLQNSYRTLRVLKGVDRDAAHGSIFSLLGSNDAAHCLLGSPSS